MEFKAFPKLPRLNRPVVVTEKLDGTNACIIIEEVTEGYNPDGGFTMLTVDGTFYNVGAQSRNRLISPADDNMGFAHFVFANPEALVRLLGPGYHYGEWWGRKIARGYGLQERRFSLFNTSRWEHLFAEPVALEGGTVSCVPVLERLEVFDTQLIRDNVAALLDTGSLAAPGFMKPEGVVVFHEASGNLYKVLCENDELPKSVADKGRMPE